MLGTGNATFSGDVNITQTTDVGVLNVANLDDGSAVGLSLTYPTSNVAAGDGLALAIGIAGRGRSYIANSNVTDNLDASNLVFYTEGGGTIVERMIIDTNGYVGIGTTDPSVFNSRGRNLVVAGSGDVGITINSDDTDSGTLLFSDGNGGTAAYRGVIEYDHADNSMAFTTAAVEALSLNSDQSATFTGSITTASGQSISNGGKIIMQSDGTLDLGWRCRLWYFNLGYRESYNSSFDW